MEKVSRRWVDDVEMEDAMEDSDTSSSSSNTNVNPFVTKEKEKSPLIVFQSTSVVVNDCNTKSNEKDSKKEKDDDLPKACCKVAGELLASLGQDANQLPVGALIRLIYAKLGPFDPGKRDPLLVLAFDISFLWHYEEVLGPCKEGDLELDSLKKTWRGRPSQANVSNCHSSAVAMLTHLGGGRMEKAGTTGANASNEKDMKKHRETSKSLCVSLEKYDRGVWQVSHCGHSWTFIKRHGLVEVIDAFANDRGLGVWAVTAEEKVEWPNKVHPPPKKRLWKVKELIEVVPLLVDDELETRQKAQTVIVNYGFENPYGSDHLPTGAFGYDCHALIAEDEIVRALGQRFCHAYNRWKQLAGK